MLYGLASKHFGISKLHPFQAESVLKAISGHDTLIVQPTGKGKSLCYQLVTLLQRKIAFVFTPTLALMYDQVMRLQERGISSVALGSDGDRVDSLHDSTGGVVVYLTAEYIYSPSKECERRLAVMKQLVDEGRVCLIALDEAHLIFEWEHFRYVSVINI